MDGAQVAAEHPDGGIKPLEGGEGVDEDEVPRMAEPDVSPFMSENRSIMGFVVATVHHDIVHPAEWRDVCVTGHADDGAIILRMLLTMVDKTDNPEQRTEGMAQCDGRAYDKQDGQRYLPPRCGRGLVDGCLQTFYRH